MHGLDKLVIENEAFDLPWLKLGDQMVFERGSPSVGDFTILEHGGKLTPLWLLGLGRTGLYYIVCDKCFVYPEATELATPNKFEWVMLKNV